MYLKIKKIEKKKNEYGNDLVISMIGLHEDDGKWIKWVKLNDELIKTLTESKIDVKLD